MDHFNTTIFSLTLPTEGAGRSQIISDEAAFIVTKILLYGVSPTIGCIGVIFNIFSVIVLFKSGLHKCSNILLFSLAFMDMGFLIGYNSVPNLLYSVYGGGRFLYSEPVSFFLYVMYLVAIVVDYGMGMSALTVPMFITLERIVAVYFPLKFGQIITPRRTWAAIGATVIFWVLNMAYTCFWYKFEYVFDKGLNRSVGLIKKSDLFYKDFDSILIFEEIMFNVKVPPVVTVVGCVAIIVKVKVTSRKRSKMTSSKVVSTSKTTRTLLAVFFAYLFACTALSVPSYLPEHLSAYSMTTGNPTNMATIIYFIINILYMCNSSWNFLAYVGLNKNFRDTFKEILVPKSCVQS